MKAKDTPKFTHFAFIQIKPQSQQHYSRCMRCFMPPLVCFSASVTLIPAAVRYFSTSALANEGTKRSRKLKNSNNWRWLAMRKILCAKRKPLDLAASLRPELSLV